MKNELMILKKQTDLISSLDIVLAANTRSEYRVKEFLALYPIEEMYRLFVDGRLYSVDKYTLWEDGWIDYEKREPGSLSSMFKGLEYILQLINNNTHFINLDLIKNLHRICMQYVKGKNNYNRHSVNATGDFRSLYESSFQLHRDHIATVKGLANLLNEIEYGDIGRASACITPFSGSLSNRKKGLYIDRNSLPFIREKIILNIKGKQKTCSNNNELAKIILGKTKNFKIKTESIIIDRKKFKNYLTKNKLYYHAPKSKYVEELMLNTIAKYNTKIALLQVKDIDKKLKLIGKTIEKFERIHPYIDGNGRTFVNLLANYCLLANGFPPATFYEPNIFDIFGNHVALLKKAIHNTIIVYQGKKHLFNFNTYLFIDYRAKIDYYKIIGNFCPEFDELQQIFDLLFKDTGLEIEVLTNNTKIDMFKSTKLSIMVHSEQIRDLHHLNIENINKVTINKNILMLTLQEKIIYPNMQNYYYNISELIYKRLEDELNNTPISHNINLTFLYLFLKDNNNIAAKRFKNTALLDKLEEGDYSLDNIKIFQLILNHLKEIYNSDHILKQEIKYPFFLYQEHQQRLLSVVTKRVNAKSKENIKKLIKPPLGIRYNLTDIENLIAYNLSFDGKDILLPSNMKTYLIDKFPEVKFEEIEGVNILKLDEISINNAMVKYMYYMQILALLNDYNGSNIIISKLEDALNDCKLTNDKLIYSSPEITLNHSWVAQVKYGSKRNEICINHDIVANFPPLYKNNIKKMIKQYEQSLLKGVIEAVGCNIF